MKSASAAPVIPKIGTRISTSGMWITADATAKPLLISGLPSASQKITGITARDWISNAASSQRNAVLLACATTVPWAPPIQ